MDSQQNSELVVNRELQLIREVGGELNFIFNRSLFLRPTYLAQSAWLEHIPFALWLVETLRPRNIVELGTHYGSSYFSFCQAVSKLDLETNCFAVDTWGGDEHAGQYGEEVYKQVSEYNQQHYSDFSTLIRSTFDQALDHFPQGSIDLLHIDGLHTFEAVRHDFESWLPKLSENAVVIMHDTNVRERGFGVFQLLDELKQQYPHFEFVHGHGLGVVGVGNKQSQELNKLYRISKNARATKKVRDIFYRLGKSCGESWENAQLKRQLATQQDEIQAEWQLLVEKQALERGRLAERITSQHNNMLALESQLAHAQEQADELKTAQQQLALQHDQIATQDRAQQLLATQLSSVEQQLKAEQALRQQAQAALVATTEEKQQQLDALEQVLSERFSEIATLTRQLEEHQQTQAALVVATEEKQQQLEAEQALRQQVQAALVATTEEKQQQLDELEQALSERFSKIATLTRQLEERQQTQAALVATIEEKQQQLDELERVLSERFSEIATLTRWLEEREQALLSAASEQQQANERYCAQQQAWQAEQERLIQELDQLQRQLVDVQQQAQRQQTVQEEQTRELTARNQRLEVNIAERFQELATMTRHIEQLSREIKQKDRQLQQAKERAQNLKKTVSWKLTAPVRALGRTFKENPAGTPTTESAAERIAASGLFDELWYQHRYPEVADTDLSAIEHFINVGADKGYSPSEQFDTRWYLQTYPDVAQGAINPLLHYIMHGRAEQRHCLPVNKEK